MGEAVSSLFYPDFRGAGREMVLNKDLIDGEKDKWKNTVPLKAQAGMPPSADIPAQALLFFPC